MNKKIVTNLSLMGICALSSVLTLDAASGNWYSGQYYDFNGLNTCQSTQSEDSSVDFTARVIDEHQVQLGTKTANLGQYETITLSNAGWVGSKECQILTTSTNHSPGFNSKIEE